MSLKSTFIDTPLGSMLAISDEEKLYLLDFAESKGVERKIKKLKVVVKSDIVSGITKPISLVKKELKSYFDGNLQKFNTSLCLVGSKFQKLVWQKLINVPYGETRSYFTQAKVVGKETAYRAVANANGANRFAIIIPCHRIINNNGEFGGYGSGLYRKKWLIEHEKKFTTN